MSRFPSPLALPEDPSGSSRLAENIRKVLRAIRALSRIEGRNGITAQVNQAGVVLSLNRPEFAFFSRVVAVRVGAQTITQWGQQAAYATPSQVSYDVKVFGRPDIGEDDGSGDRVVRSLVPVYGRPVNEDESAIWPARVGDRCWIIRSPDQNGSPIAELHIMTERIAFRPCSEGP